MKSKKKSVETDCTCSLERLMKALAFVAIEELESMLKEDQGALIYCDFCKREYRLDGAALEQLIVTLTIKK